MKKHLFFLFLCAETTNITVAFSKTNRMKNKFTFPEFFILTTVLALSGLISCREIASENIENKEYTVTVKLPIDGFDGRICYLYRLADDLETYIPLDSTYIAGDSFSFSSAAEEPISGRYVFIGKEGENRISTRTPIIFVTEAGNIDITLDDDYRPFLQGTPKNDRFQSMISFNDTTRKTLNEFWLNNRSIFIFGVDTLPADIKQLSQNASELLRIYFEEIAGTPFFDEMMTNRFSSFLSEKDMNLLFSEHAISPRLEQEFENNAVESRNEGNLQTGDFIHELKCTDENNNTVSIYDYVGKGKITFVYIWASWCPPCRQELPLLKMVNEKYKDKNFTMVNISVDGNRDAWLKTINDYDMEWPQLRADEGEMVMKKFGFSGVPYTLLLDEEGRVIYKNARSLLIEYEVKKALNIIDLYGNGVEKPE